jgi:hypothetical protein
LSFPAQPLLRWLQAVVITLTASSPAELSGAQPLLEDKILTLATFLYAIERSKQRLIFNKDVNGYIKYGRLALGVARAENLPPTPINLKKVIIGEHKIKQLRIMASQNKAIIS